LLEQIDAYQLINPLEVLIANKQFWLIKNLSANGEDPHKFIKEFEKEFESTLQAQVEEVHGHLMDTF
jgi:hypothetical protein